MTTTRRLQPASVGVSTTSTTPTTVSTGVILIKGEDCIIESHVLARENNVGYLVLRAKMVGTDAGGTLTAQSQNVVYESSAGVDAAFVLTSNEIFVQVTATTANLVVWYVTSVVLVA